MVCQGLEVLSNYTTESILKYPLTCDYYFYLKILVGVTIFLAMTLYFEERRRTGKGNIMSSIAISCIALIFLATIGSLIGIITSQVLVLIVVASLVFIVIWLLT